MWLTLTKRQYAHSGLSVDFVRYTAQKYFHIHCPIIQFHVDKIPQSIAAQVPKLFPGL